MGEVPTHQYRLLCSLVSAEAWFYLYLEKDCAAASATKMPSATTMARTEEGLLPLPGPQRHIEQQSIPESLPRGSFQQVQFR